MSAQFFKLQRENTPYTQQITIKTNMPIPHQLRAPLLNRQLWGMEPGRTAGPHEVESKPALKGDTQPCTLP